MIKLIIFDWDDVFTKDSIKGYYKCYHEALVAVGVELPADKETELIKAKWGAGHRQQLQYILEQTGHPEPEVLDKANDAYEKHFFGTTFIGCLTSIPGSKEFLDDISKRYKIAVATGSHPDILKKRLMPKFGIPEDIFAEIMTIYYLDDIAHAKPHPMMAEKIMASVGVKPEETVLVGDATSDMQMARNAGVIPIAVLTGHLSRQEAEDMGIEHIIDDVTLLELELEKLNPPICADEE